MNKPDHSEASPQTRIVWPVLVVASLLMAIASLVFSFQAQSRLNEVLRTLSAVQMAQAAQAEASMRVADELETKTSAHDNAIAELYSNQDVLAKAAGVPVETDANAAVTPDGSGKKPQL